MIIKFLLDDIKNTHAEGLILPVDGDICVIGGTAAAKALKASFAGETEDDEELIEMYEYSEEDVAALRPLPHGKAKIILGNDYWQKLVVIAVQPHHVNDVIWSEEQFAGILKSGIINGILECIKDGIKSIALTLISTTYRLSANMAINGMTEAFATCMNEDIEVTWCFIDEEAMKQVNSRCTALGISSTLLV